MKRPMIVLTLVITAGLATAIAQQSGSQSDDDPIALRQGLASETRAYAQCQTQLGQAQQALGNATAQAALFTAAVQEGSIVDEAKLLAKMAAANPDLAIDAKTLKISPKPPKPKDEKKGGGR